jgi:HK97 family phage prohead protease
MGKMELKIQRRDMEVRAVMEADNDTRIVEGYAVRFNEPAMFMVGDTEYREIIDSSALAKTDMTDVPMKYNHSDSFMIMARTRNKTLQLIRDENGLKIRAQLADTSDGRDLYELIKRGDVDKMSFAFTVRKDEYDKKARTRTIQDIDKLYDVSAVDFPAYDTTSISARSFFELESENEHKELDRTEARQRKQQKIRTLLRIGRN